MTFISYPVENLIIKVVYYREGALMMLCSENEEIAEIKPLESDSAQDTLKKVKECESSEES